MGAEQHQQHYDMVIIGGGLYGASTAYHLLLREPGLRVCIVQPDSGYAHVASARSNGGVRILFSQEESIRMSQFGHDFYADFANTMSIDGTPSATRSISPRLFADGHVTAPSR